MKLLLILSVAYCSLYLASSSATGSRPKSKLDPSHVPSSACENMLPIHNTSLPSTDPAPYTINPSRAVAFPGDIIQVLVVGDNDTEFKGLYMQARVLGSGTDAVGEFTAENLDLNPAIRISSCPPGHENAISYISRSGIGSITLEWKVPEDVSGSVYFRGTFVESFSRFWANVDSAPVLISVSKENDM